MKPTLSIVRFAWFIRSTFTNGVKQCASFFQPPCWRPFFRLQFRGAIRNSKLPNRHMANKRSSMMTMFIMTIMMSIRDTGIILSISATAGRVLFFTHTRISATDIFTVPGGMIHGITTTVTATPRDSIKKP